MGFPTPISVLQGKTRMGTKHHSRVESNSEHNIIVYKWRGELGRKSKGMVLTQYIKTLYTLNALTLWINIIIWKQQKARNLQLIIVPDMVILTTTVSVCPSTSIAVMVST